MNITLLAYTVLTVVLLAFAVFALAAACEHRARATRPAPETPPDAAPDAPRPASAAARPYEDGAVIIETLSPEGGPS